MSIYHLIKIFISSAFIGVAISYGDIYLFHLLMLSLFTVFSYKLKQSNYVLDYSLFKIKYVPSLLVIFLWYLISLSWAPNIELGLKYMFYIFCGIMLSLSIIYYSKDIKNFNSIFNILSMLVILEVFLSLCESFTSFRMPISSLSSISHFFGKESKDLLEINLPFSLYNFGAPTGFRWNTNDLAVCMLVSLPFFLCNDRVFFKIVGTSSIVLIIVMTASRAAFLALLFIFIIYLTLIKKKIGTLFFIFSVLLGVFWGMNVFSGSENPRINEIANSISALSMYLSGEIDIGGSLQWRRELINNGLAAFSNSYGLGLGAGGATANQELIGPVAGRFTSMHNFWIELLVEGGIFAGIIIFFWLTSMIIRLFKVSRRSFDLDVKYYSQSLFLSMIGFIPAAVAASSTIYFLPMWIIFGLSISVINLSRLGPS